MKHRSTLAFMAILFSSLTSNAQIQAGVGVPKFERTEMERHYRLAASIGGNLGKILDAPLAFEGTLTYQRSNVALGLSALASTNGGNPSQDVVEADGLIGYAETIELTHSSSKPETIYLSASTGLGLSSYFITYRRRRGQAIDSTRPANTSELGYAIPFRFQAIYEPFHFAGIGLTVFASFGALRPNMGALVTLMVGWF